MKTAIALLKSIALNLVAGLLVVGSIADTLNGDHLSAVILMALALCLNADARRVMAKHDAE